MGNLIVTIGGIGLIAGIFWFFFGKKDEAVIAGDSITITVNGGYKPNSIRLKKGKKSTLTLVRIDPNTCLEDFYIPDFKIKKYLPMNTPVTVTLSPDKTGNFDFHCGMNMFHGTIHVA
jgi:plastocyanin domain-containing protein